MTRILIMEDSAAQARQLECLLKSQGYEVGVATDGHQGLSLLEKGGYDLVLSDVLMPCLSGYDACRSIKSNPNTKDIPVVLLTALNNPWDIVQGLICGADHFIRKPFHSQDLFARIRNILAARAQRRENKFEI